MTKEKKVFFTDGFFEFPLSMVIIENLFMLLWIVVGAYICWEFVPLYGFSYLGFGLSMVYYVMRILVCRNCYYYGKMCHTGWGKLSKLYCKKGDVEQFGKGFNGLVIPLFYGSMALLPLILGIISLYKNFSIFKIVVLIIFLFIVVMSSFILRKKGCAKCKMRNICPGSASK
jgi:hypothetical protein